VTRESMIVRCAILGVVAGILGAGIVCATPEADRATESSPGASAPAAVVVGTRDSLLIRPNAVGGIALDMTIAEAQVVLPSASLERTSDGEGAALVSVSFGDAVMLLLFAGELDAAAPIDPSKRIELIEAIGTSCQTPEGVGPGSSVADVERVYGRATRIVRSEIESREFIEFERAPSAYVFRIRTAGDAPTGVRAATRADTSAVLHSIAITRARAD